MTNLTVIIDLSKVSEIKTLSDIYVQIRNGSVKKQIEEIRNLVSSNQIDEANSIKKRLLGFTPSGTFNKSRKSENLKEYSGYVILDYDGLKSDEISSLKPKLCTDQHTHVCFISPSGTGLKVIVRTSADRGQHEDAYNKVLGYYERQYGYKIDSSGKDIARLCFYSYDPDAYFNPDSKVFQVVLTGSDHTSSQEDLGKDFDALYSSVKEYTDSIKKYYKGNRNNYLYLLACNCNRIGIPASKALEYILKEVRDLKKAEVENTVKSAYKNKYEHGMGLDIFYKPTNRQTDTTPYFPDWVYERLPEPLFSACKSFNDKRQKDVFLLSALVALSACFPNVYSIYDGKKHYPNLYALILAPPASGKRVAEWARKLVSKVHEYLKSIIDIDDPQYDEDSKKGKKQFERGLFIPGNTSDAALVEKLSLLKNGLIFETESMTMGKTLQKEWGNFIDIILKGFHHESHSLQRKTNKEEISIDKVIISILLTGTPNQLKAIISSKEDGLYSRFAVYRYNPIFKYQSPYDDVKSKYEDLFAKYANIVLDIVEKVEKYGEVQFKITEIQRKSIESSMESWIKQGIEKFGDAGESSIKRLDLICHRIAMILSVLRQYDKIEGNELIPDDLDMAIAYKIGGCLKDHTYTLMQEEEDLKEANYSEAVKRRKLLINLLPAEFKTEEAIRLASEFFTEGSRTIERDLTFMVNNGTLSKDKHGNYRKSI